MVVLLHNIRSLHNVGSILRTADGAGVQKVYLCGITPSPLNRFGEVVSDIQKTALGAEQSVPWEKVRSTAFLIKKLQSQGYYVVAAEKDKRAVDYRTFKKGKKKIALVMGAEVEGLSQAILDKCDTIVEIPMRGEKESLNVSVAFGIVAYALAND